MTTSLLEKGKVITGSAITADTRELLTVIRQVAGATAGPKDQRPNLNFIHIIVGNGSIKLEATDGLVLDSAEIPATATPNLVDKKFYIDGQLAKQLSKAPSKHKGSIEIRPKFIDGKFSGKTAVIVDNESVTDNSAGKISPFGYPDLSSFEPVWEESQTTFITTKKELLPLLRKAKKATSSKNNYQAHFIEKSGAIYLDYKDEQAIIPTKSVDLTGNSQDNKHELIMFNVSKLINEIKHAKAVENLEFHIFGARRPLAIKRGNGYSILCPLVSKKSIM